MSVSIAMEFSMSFTTDRNRPHICYCEEIFFLIMKKCRVGLGYVFLFIKSIMTWKFLFLYELLIVKVYFH